MPSENLSGRSVAQYRLLERVGEGGTATVYRAQHPERGECAVKILKERSRSDATAVQRFLREAGYGSRIQHPNVVTTFEFGEQEGLHYLALEWAEGQLLTDVVTKRGALEMEVVAHIMEQLADGLAIAHGEGIIHRDLKPENIIFDPDSGVAKLLDFGIARDAQEDPSQRLTRTGFFVGSLNYVAPEALSGELVDEKADIYSLATITYHLLTGLHPHSGRSPREVFQQLLTQHATPLNRPEKGARRFPARVERVIMRSLSREPKERHASAKAFAADLRAAVHGTNGDAGPGSGATGEVAEGEGAGLMGRIRGLFGKQP